MRVPRADNPIFCLTMRPSPVASEEPSTAYLATYVDERFGLHISFIGKPGSSPRHGDNNVDFHPRGHSETPNLKSLFNLWLCYEYFLISRWPAAPHVLFVLVLHTPILPTS